MIFSALVKSSFTSFDLGKFLFFVFFPHEGLDDADAADVFLYGIVHRVVLFEDTAEEGHDETHNGDHHH